jgi:DNA polymerase III subunit gamma/tau
MSYLVLARKYRPRNFAEMVGQDHVVQALTNALTTQRLHHAYFFTGTRGVGKTTVSRILAKSLNCQGADGQGGITATPCGVCDACRAIDSGRFVDYIELDAASHRGVEEVQSLLEQAVYKPVQGRFKVFMIDEVHMLTNTAFNAMLKTLEEPPAYLKFVLATTDPQKVPVTVLSRCLQFNLRPMAPLTIQEHLVRVLQAEQVTADAQSLRLLARAARGSMRDALSLADQAIAFGSGQLLEAPVRQMLGSVDRSYIFHLIDALARADGAAVVSLVDELQSNGFNAASTLEEMAGVLQQMAVLQTQEPQGVTALEDEADPDASQTRRLAALLPNDELHLLYSICLHGRADLGLAPDEYAALTMVLLRLLAFKSVGTQPMPPRTVPPVRMAEKKTVLTPPVVKVAAPPAIAPTQPRVAPALAVAAVVPEVVTEVVTAVAAPTVDPTPQVGSLDDFWYDLVRQLIAADAVSALVRELALQSQLVRKDQAEWQLRVERESLLHAANRQRLTQAVQQLGLEVALMWTVGSVTDNPQRRNAAASAQKQASAEQLVQTHPLVQTLMHHFAATIVTGSLQPL